MDLVNVPAKFEVPSFIRSWDNSDWRFGWGYGLYSYFCGLDRPL